MNDARVKFVDGCVITKNKIIIATRLVELADTGYDLTRMFLLRANQWGQFDLRLHVRSLCTVYKPYLATYCLGRDGRISVQRSPELGGPFEESLPDAGTGQGKLGLVSVIREIGEGVYVCGAAGQVYRRERGGWVHFDEGILDREGGLDALSVFCIHGSSERDIYAVGEAGLLFHYDGRSWTRLQAPVNQNFYWVRCISRDNVYICGSEGTLLQGTRDHWEDHSIADVEQNFWSIESFMGEVYLASASRLYKFDGEKVTPVRTGLRPKPDAGRLHANDGVLWSFGPNHLCFFDGQKWTYVKHPDNP